MKSTELPVAHALPRAQTVSLTVIEGIPPPDRELYLERILPFRGGRKSDQQRLLSLLAPTRNDFWQRLLREGSWDEVATLQQSTLCFLFSPVLLDSGSMPLTRRLFDMLSHAFLFKQHCLPHIGRHHAVERNAQNK